MSSFYQAYFLPINQLIPTPPLLPDHTHIRIQALWSRFRAVLFSVTAVPNLFGTRDQVSWKTIFPWIGKLDGGYGLGMIQMHYTCCTPYFYYYYIRSTSYHQTLDPGSCGTPALQNLQCLNTVCVCRTLCNPTDCILPGSSVHEILQAKILEWLAMPPPGYLPDPGIKPASLLSPTLACGFFTSSTTWEVLPKHNAATQCLILSKCSVNIC